MISGATRLSVELAIALLTVLFYHHNQKISAEKHCCSSKVKPVAPDDTCDTAGLLYPYENVPLNAGAIGEGSNDAECSGSPVDSSSLANPVIVWLRTLMIFVRNQLQLPLFQQLLTYRSLYRMSLRGAVIGLLTL